MSKAESQPETKPQSPARFEHRSIKTPFTPEERESLVGDLLRARREFQNAETEFEGVKANHKARLTAVEARIDQVATSLENGFEMRVRRCLVVFAPKEQKKYFYPEGTELSTEGERPEPLLVEAMSQEDYQQELVLAESKFEAREELPLFAPVGESRGVLVVGRWRDRWYAALRIFIEGRAAVEERLDAEQKAFKERADVIKMTAKRALSWLGDVLGKEAAAGFQADIQAMVEAQKERAE